MGTDALLAAFCEVAGEVSDRPLPALDMSTDIQGLGIDSLGMMEIIGVLEERFDILLPDEELTGLRTVGDLVERFRLRLEPV